MDTLSSNFNNTPQIAGMLPGDNGIEFIGIRETQKVVWLQNGNNHYFSDLPLASYQLLKSKYLKDHKAVRFLSEVSNEQSRQIELYTYYVYGAADSTPDILNGVLSESENFRHSRNCPSLMWNSKNINIAHHILTPRQLVIIDLIRKDLPDKAIASALNISHKTLDFHKSKLYKSVGVTTKLALLTLCFQYNIVN